MLDSKKVFQVPCVCDDITSPCVFYDIASPCDDITLPWVRDDNTSHSLVLHPAWNLGEQQHTCLNVVLQSFSMYIPVKFFSKLN